jgi:hypothetical protein
MSHRLSVSAMMLSVPIKPQFKALLIFPSLVRRYGFHLKDAKSKRTSLVLFKREGPSKTFPILQSISISVAETSMTMLRKPQRKIIQSLNSRGLSILLSAALLLNPQHSNPTTILSQIWLHAWVFWRRLHPQVERLL